MEKRVIEPTSNTPEVTLDFANGDFYLGGESYSEEVADLYDEVTAQLHTYLEAAVDRAITLTCALIYFNSFSSRRILTLLRLFDEAAKAGNTVEIIWVYRESDDNMLEYGEDFGEDVEHAKFVLREIPDDD